MPAYHNANLTNYIRFDFCHSLLSFSQRPILLFLHYYSCLNLFGMFIFLLYGARVFRLPFCFLHSSCILLPVSATCSFLTAIIYQTSVILSCTVLLQNAVPIGRITSDFTSPHHHVTSQQDEHIITSLSSSAASSYHEHHHH